MKRFYHLKDTFVNFERLFKVQDQLDIDNVFKTFKTQVIIFSFKAILLLNTKDS